MTGTDLGIIVPPLEQEARAHKWRVGSKPASASMTESTHMIMRSDLNGGTRLFGGRLMEWIDMTAAIAARRHCGTDVTTASVDYLVFKHPAFLNDIVVISAYVTYVGTTSLEVRVDTFVENVETGQRHLINNAYLTEVSVGDDERPLPIRYDLELTDQEGRDEWEAARKRRAVRRARKEQGF